MTETGSQGSAGAELKEHQLGDLVKQVGESLSGRQRRVRARPGIQGVASWLSFGTKVLSMWQLFEPLGSNADQPDIL